MKSNLTIIASFILCGTIHSSFAASVESCRSRVEDTCYSRITSGLSRIMKSAQSCRFVKDGSYSENIAFISSNSYRLTSVDVQLCRVSDYSFNSGYVTDQAVFGGRLFVTLSSKRVVLLGRNNEIYELKNSKGEPYESVNSVKVDSKNNAIILERDNNQTTSLTMEQIQKRIDSRKIEAIAGSY